MSISDYGAQFQEKDENGVFQPIYPITKVEYVKGNIVQSVNGIAPDENGNVTATYTLPNATSDTLGGIILGNTLTITSDGKVDITKEGISSALGYKPLSEDDITEAVENAGMKAKIVDDGVGGIDIVYFNGDKLVIEEK